MRFIGAAAVGFLVGVVLIASMPSALGSPEPSPTLAGAATPTPTPDPTPTPVPTPEPCDPRLGDALLYVGDARTSHEYWLERVTKYPDAPDVQRAGDAEWQRTWIARYETLDELLRASCDGEIPPATDERLVMTPVPQPSCSARVIIGGGGDCP